MIAKLSLRRADGWLIAALVVSMVGLCWHPSWWMIGAVLLVVTSVLLEWQRTAWQCDRATEEIGRLTARIRDIANLQGRFVGSIAHEIKTPLSLVLGETGLLLLRSEDATAVRGIAKSMAAEVRHLSDLVESVLRLANPFVHEDKTSHVPIFVGDLVIAVVARCRELSTKLSVHVVTVLCQPDNGDPSAEVEGDSLLLEAMVENLLRNALRFSPPGAEVELTTHADADSVAIVVRDHGIGMPPEQRESMFDWFFEGPGRPSKTLGTGFGLAIAKRVVDHHGGTITLRDTLDGGCEFEVTLPRCWPLDPSADAVLKRQSEPPVAPTA
ncbi:MAG: HAMP domain-containing sensor histidine kinase [Planctomycetota bacterium]